MITETIHTTTLFSSLDAVWNELISLLQNVTEDDLNTTPFENSWTAAQVLVHITKSNKAIIQGLQMQGKPAGRDPEENAEQIKKMFLDFTVKYNSPEFIIPENGYHNKTLTVSALTASIQSLQQKRNETDLAEIIFLPAFGEVTKLELLHFVLYHTQRHIHQLNNILAAIN